MAKNIFELDNPIKVNNEVLTELAYDYFEITNDLYLEAAMRSSRVGGTINSAMTKEVNEALIFCFGKAAIIAANPKISWEDLEQLKGFDLLSVSNIGRFFIMRKREGSEQNHSDEQSAPIPNDSTQASETLDE